MNVTISNGSEWRKQNLHQPKPNQTCLYFGKHQSIDGMSCIAKTSFISPLWIMCWKLKEGRKNEREKENCTESRVNEFVQIKWVDSLFVPSFLLCFLRVCVIISIEFPNKLVSLLELSREVSRWIWMIFMTLNEMKNIQVCNFISKQAMASWCIHLKTECHSIYMQTFLIKHSNASTAPAILCGS